MPSAARSLHGPHSFPWPKNLERVEIGCLARHASLEFPLQFVGAVHPEVRIINEETVIGSQRDRTVDGLDALLKERIVVVDVPPTLPVVGVCDVELCPRVPVRGVGALEGEAGFLERIATEERETVGHGLRVDLIYADGGREPAGDFRDSLRLS